MIQPGNGSASATASRGVRLGLSARLLDLDGGVVCQERLMSRLGDGLNVTDLRGIGPHVRYLATRRSMAVLESSLLGGGRYWLNFLGSGDFHHVTAALVRRFVEPISIVSFDLHPDWYSFSPWPCCGSWLNEVLRLPNVHKVVIIGLGKVDVDGWRINWGPVRHLLTERVALYPYDCELSRCIGRHSGFVDCATFRPSGYSSEIHWNTIAGGDWETFMRQVIDSLPTRRVYLTIDKDCLNEEAACTNWETGHLTLDQLVSGVRLLAGCRKIVGVDITGEYSPVEIGSRLFRRLSDRDHPKRLAPSSDELRRNEDTNLALIESLGF